MYKYISKNFIIFIFIILLVGIGLLIAIKTNNTDIPFVETSPLHGTSDIPAVTQTTSIGEKIPFDEENITGNYPRITGDSVIATLAQKQIAKFIDEITQEANRDLPELRKEFPDVYTSDRKYEVNVQASVFTSDQTQSLALLEYMYTGGANGNSFHVTFNQNNDGEIIELGNLVDPEKRTGFVSLVKERLRNYNNPEYEEVELFEDAINEINFQQLDRFIIKDKNLTIYFDKYEVGAGAVGPINIVIEDFKKTIAALDSEKDI